MQCKEYEYLIIESSERDLTAEEQLKLKKHCSLCENCSRLKENIEEIRFSLKQSDPPELPSSLDKKTQQLCNDEINRKKLLLQHKQRSFWAPVPGYIWAAFILLTIMTSFLLFPELKNLNSDKPLSLWTIFMLTIILQNAVMLFLSPVIIRRHKAKQGFSNLNKLEYS